MSRRTWKVLWGTLLVLVLYILLVERPFTDDVRGPSRTREMFESLDATAATAIRIRTGAAETRLEKDGGSWWVVAGDGRFPADAKAVNELLARLDTLQAGPVVSQNPAKRATFGVDSTGIEVVVSAGPDQPAHFRLGRSTPDYSGLFLRPEGSDEVYGIAGLTRYHFDRGPDAWRDRRLVPFDAEVVTRLAVAWNDSALTLTRQGSDSLMNSSWTVSGQGPGEPDVPAVDEAARPLVEAAAGLTADGFPTAADTIPSNWESPALRLEIEARGGDRVTLLFGPLNARGQRYVRREGEGSLALVSPARLERFRKAWADMRRPVTGE